MDIDDEIISFEKDDPTALLRKAIKKELPKLPEEQRKYWEERYEELFGEIDAMRAYFFGLSSV